MANRFGETNQSGLLFSLNSALINYPFTQIAYFYFTGVIKTKFGNNLHSGEIASPAFAMREPQAQGKHHEAR
ncbi:hypothetical protein [Calothrix sp. NIES-2098]|uniref:hypothetical protein n=1 Tax=Calothrix sp. NIES-2098 TaxID=1954171 RepID=UPI000BBB97F2